MSMLTKGDQVYTLRNPDRIMTVVEIYPDSQFPRVKMGTGPDVSEIAINKSIPSCKVVCSWNDQDNDPITGIFREDVLIKKKDRR